MIDDNKDLKNVVVVTGHYYWSLSFFFIYPNALSKCHLYPIIFPAMTQVNGDHLFTGKSTGHVEYVRDMNIYLSNVDRF